MSRMESNEIARGRKVEAPSEPVADPLMSELVTYLAGDDGSPATVKFAGHTFRANVPQRVEMPKSWFDMVRGNLTFVVGEFDPANLRPPPAAPIKTDKQYRAHVARGLRQATGARELIRQWVRDTQLRAECDVGSDDFDYLGSLIEPRLAELAKMDGLNDKQIAALWVENGVFQKPWRGVNAVEVRDE
jgi:hypothetical protein